MDAISVEISANDTTHSTMMLDGFSPAKITETFCLSPRGAEILEILNDVFDSLSLTVDRESD